MKTFCLSMLMLALVVDVNASHLMGGQITIKHVINNKYLLKLTLYRDTLGVGLTTMEYVKQEYLDASNNYVPVQVRNCFRDYTQISLGNVPYGVEVGIYSDTVLLNPNTNYRFSYQSCCRNGAIINANLANGSGMALYTLFNTASNSPNSSPDFMLPPITFFPPNMPVNYNPLPFDINGDSISWELQTPLQSVSNQAYNPIPGFVAPYASPSGPFTMNQVTGHIIWIPNLQGNFVQSFKIGEYKNNSLYGSTIRDFQYVVTAGTSENYTMPYFTLLTPVYYDTAQKYNYVYYTPGQTTNVLFTGNDLQNANSLTMHPFSELYLLGHQITFNTNFANQTLYGTFSWNPPLGFNKSATVVVRLGDGLYSTDYTLRLMRKPLGLIDLDAPSALIQLFPNPASNHFALQLQVLTDGLETDVAIYNIYGERMQNIYRGMIAQGSFKFEVDTRLPSGLYFIRVIADGTPIKAMPLTIN